MNEWTTPDHVTSRMHELMPDDSAAPFPITRVLHGDHVCRSQIKVQKHVRVEQSNFHVNDLLNVRVPLLGSTTAISSIHRNARACAYARGHAACVHTYHENLFER